MGTVNPNRARAAPRHDVPDEEIEEALTVGVRARVRGSHAPALLLSGGIDSSLLATIAVGMGTTTAYAIDVERTASHTASQLAARLGIDHRVVTVDANTLLEALHAYVATNGVPVTRLGPLAMYRLGHVIAQDSVRTVLSGEGADELFFGYDSYKRALLTQLLSRYPSSVRLRSAAARIGETANLRSLNARGAIALWENDPATGLLPSAYRSESVGFLARLLHADHRQTVERRRMEMVADGVQRESVEPDLLTAVQGYEIDHLLAGYLLQSQSDHAIAANGVEARFPFLSTEVSELASTISPKKLLVGLEEKLPLRRLLARRLDVAFHELPRRSAFRIEMGVVLADDVVANELFGLVTEAPKDLFDAQMLQLLVDRVRRRRTASEREASGILLAASYALLASNAKRLRSAA